MASDGSTNASTPAVILPDVIVTATRRGQPLADVPYTVNEVTADDLKKQQPRTLPESLKELPSVMVQKTAHGQGSPFIRGFTGFRTLMLIDGIRLNNSVFREGPNQYWNTVDIQSVERLEVVKGPSSVLYGSDAIGGTVNAITTRRQEFGPDFAWDRRAYYRFATAEDSHTGRGEISANFDDNLGVLFGGTWKDYGDLRGGDDVGRQRKTGYGEYDWDAKLEYRLNTDTKLVLAHQTVSLDDVWRTHRTPFGLLWEGTARGTDKELSYDQDRDLTYLQFHALNLPSFVEEVHASVSHHFQREREFRLRSNNQSQRQGFDVNTFGTFLQLQSPSPVGTWVYGVEYYRDWVDSSSTRYNANGTVAGVDIQGPVGDEATYDLAGVFIQDTIPLGERCELVLGGRFNYAAAEADAVRDPITGTQTSVSDDWNALVGSGRLIYHLDEQDHWQIFGGVSQGFRAPNLSDLTRLDIAASGELETAAPGLAPEYFTSYEAGVRASYGQVQAQAAYFYTVIDDMIVRTPTGKIVAGANEVTKRNAGDGYVQGVELSGLINLNRCWSVRGASTWMEGEVDGYPTSAPVLVREPISRLMPTTLQLALRWEEPKRKFWAEIIGTWADRQNELSAADLRDTQRIPPDGTPGYSVYTLRGGWRITKWATLTASVENMTDEDYRIHGSGLNEPGRNIVIGADLVF